MLGGIAHVTLVPDGHPGLFWVSLGAIATTFVAIVAWGDRIAPLFPSPLLRALDVIVTNVSVAIVATEVLLHLLAWLRPSPLFAGLYDPLHVIDANRARPGLYYFGFPMSAEGFYDDEPGGAGKLCVVIADSFGIGVVPHGRHFTTVCERELPGWSVLNVGVQGVGPLEYVELLKRAALPRHPSAIVVSLFVGNDFTNACPRPHRLFGRQNLLVALVPPRVVRLVREYARQGSRLPGGTSAALRDQRLLSDAEVSRAFPWIDDPLREIPTFTPEGFLEIETRHARDICAPGAPCCKAETLAAIEAMKTLAGSVPFLLMVIPDEMQVEDSVWNDVTGSLAGTPLDRDLPQRVLERELSARGIRELDLLPAMRAVPPLPDGRRHLYALRDTHWNARGNEVAGRALARALE